MNTPFTNFSKFLGSAAIVAALVATSACTNSREIADDGDNQVVYENASDIPGAYYVKASDEVRQEKQELRNELNEQLNKVDLQIEKLEDKAKSVSATARQEYDQVIDQLDKERERLVAEYKNLEDATDDTWENVKGRVKGVMGTVDKKVSDLASRIED